MARSNWSNQSQVSGQSPCVDELVKTAEQVVEAVKPLIEKKMYLRNFLDKVCRCVRFFLSRFWVGLFYLETTSCKPHGVDTDNLYALLLV